MTTMFRLGALIVMVVLLSQCGRQTPQTWPVVASGKSSRLTAPDAPLSPWTVEAIEAGFKIVDGNGQSLAYVYGYAHPRDAAIAKALTLDEARRIAANIAKLPKLLRREA
jgi:hypothetical protein